MEARIANLERLSGKREFELDWLTKKSRGLGLYGSAVSSWTWTPLPELPRPAVASANCRACNAAAPTTSRARQGVPPEAIPYHSRLQGCRFNADHHHGTLWTFTAVRVSRRSHLKSRPRRCGGGGL